MQHQGTLTLADLVLPRRSVLVNSALVLAGSIGIAFSAQIAIPLMPVPVTGQTFAVLLVGALLGGRLGAAAVLAYLAEGAIGLPVFSGLAGGAAHHVGPTGGYLAAFLPAAWIVGALCERGWDRRTFTAAVAMTIGTIVILAGGVSWLAAFTGVEKALTLGLYPFLIGAVIKIALAALALPLGWKLLGKIKE